jgi:hypothetical protein
MKYVKLTIFIVGPIMLSACLKQSTQTQVMPGSMAPTISWEANREKSVNSVGGGYRVYYSSTSGFDIANAQSINVPYISGGKAPTSVVISSLNKGKYYFKVAAYSSLGTSAASAETSLEIK